MNSKRCAALLLSLGAAMLGIAGCGEAGDSRVRVAGDVSYNDKPIITGSIRFVPEAGTDAPVAGGPIQGGSYALAGKQALRAGSYRVEVKGFRNRDGSEGPVDLSQAEADFVQYVPSKYHSHSELRLTLDADGPDDLRHDLKLSK